MSEVVLGLDPITGEVKGKYVINDAKKLRPQAPFQKWVSLNQATVPFLTKCKSLTDIHVFLCLLSKSEDGNAVKCTQREIAEMLGIGPQHVSTAISNLTKADLVRKVGERSGTHYVLNESVTWKGRVDGYTKPPRPIGSNSAYPQPVRKTKKDAA